ncbi:phosphoribosyltransferase-like protein [Agrobacterium vitis]
MTSNVFDNDRVAAWLDQFEAGDRANASLMLSAVKLVSADEFTDAMMGILDSLAAKKKRLALYNETERPRRNGRPHRLFTETTTKVKRATGNGPALVPRQRYVDESVGSEGVVATLISQFRKTNSSIVDLNPGPNIIRKRQSRHFVLVTDFIGSGQRAIDFLDAAWRVRSTRSWWSRRTRAGLSFDVVAFAGTDDGIERLRMHTSKPNVHVFLICPTIQQVFSRPQAAAIEALCVKYVPKRLRDDALGFQKTGALIGFSHSMPNNAPPILWKKFGKWTPLFPSRVTTSTGSPFRAATAPEAQQHRLETIVGLQPSAEPLEPITLNMIVLAALGRGNRQKEALSGRLGVSISAVSMSLAELRSLGLIDNHNQFTDKGRQVFKRLKKTSEPKVLPKAEKGDYFPRSLRVPHAF